MGTKEYHWASITNIDDPERRGRVCVNCPTIAEDDELEWLEPSFGFVDTAANAGSFFVPTVGSMVEVEVENEPGEGGGTTDLQPKWKCSVYSDGTIPDVFSDRDHYPNRKGFVTRAGHILYVDDSDGEETFYYKHPTGTEIVVESTGKIQLRGNVEIGVDPTEPCVLGNALKSYIDTTIMGIYNGHSHTGHGVVPTAPLMTAVPASVLSSTNKVL